MFTIDLTLKNVPFPVSLERKSEEDAEALFQEILTAMNSGKPEILEAKSEGKQEKKVAIRSSEISGVQMTRKEGSGASAGRQPGFFALTSE
ncbi:MAG: hypothetical protein AAFX80_06475 [Cyanobacteria bacterium J06639_18]